ncbi:unnamed protein product [Ilex paraguariensis]|uniref:RING-CH-type domain-containing protein n=1 Tax=Ilex paraguariensis TaxID=185542 RepID=A0ABC8RAC8_9AQUA
MQMLTGLWEDFTITSLKSSPRTAQTPPLARAKVSSVADCSVDVENEVGEIKVQLRKSESDCRICHLSLESTGPESEIAIELCCSCKDDLSATHTHYADTWFKIKGNK